MGELFAGIDSLLLKLGIPQRPADSTDVRQPMSSFEIPIWGVVFEYSLQRLCDTVCFRAVKLLD